MNEGFDLMDLRGCMNKLPFWLSENSMGGFRLGRWEQADFKEKYTTLNAPVGFNVVVHRGQLGKNVTLAMINRTE